MPAAAGLKDPFAGTPYGTRAGTCREVTSFDGTILAVDDVGPPAATDGVIFAHGVGLDARVWWHQWQERHPWRTILFDARGHARSGQVGTAARTLASYAEDLQAVIDGSGLRRAVLVGHSMGGMTLLQQRWAGPGSVVRGLVLVNTTYAEVLHTFAPVRSPRLERWAQRAGEWLVAEPSRMRWTTLRDDRVSRVLVRAFGFGYAPSATQVAFVTRLLATSTTHELSDLWRSMFSFDEDEDLAAIVVPTLVVAGGRDRMTAPSASRHMAGRIPGAELATLPLAGHMSFLEEPERFNALLKGFVARVLDVPAAP